MKLLFSSLIFSALSMSVVSADDTGDNWNYDSTCIDQSQCLVLQVAEEQRKCGSASCEFEVCWETVVGIDFDMLFMEETAEADQAIFDGCKEERTSGIDYIGDVAKSGSLDSAEGGCPNDRNADGKGFWDNNCHDPDTTVGSGGGLRANFEKVCQVVAPGHTIHFLMHSNRREDKDWQSDTDGQLQELSCSGAATLDDTGGKNLGNASCHPSTSNPYAQYGQTYFPTDDPSQGGTCIPPAGTGGIKAEGVECVWSYTAPSTCQFEENDPICYDNRNADTLCDAGPVAELFVHSSNPNQPPPQVPLHNIKHNNDDGETVTFSLFNPYADPNASLADSIVDAHDMYVVYDQANEVGNEVCNQETAYGNCATNTEYTAKCRSDGYAVVTVFASGKDAASDAHKQITNESGTDVYRCCANQDQPHGAYGSLYTAAWTYLLHCECPASQAGRRHLSLSSISERFQAGDLFTGETKELYNL